jgi:eukaryotic-like serine/threonine-protein kinase
MSAPEHTERHATKLEMAHVLFMDIVGYSKLPMDHQEAVLHTLQAVVSATPEFLRAQASHEMIRLPTGDGMALVFFEDAEAAARCALEVSRALKSHPEVPLRMGLHSGPVYRVTDINANQNVAGGGINIAQRVMDCGDAGHILASQSVADVLGQLSSWRDYLHDLGEAEVKHGVRVRLYNLYTDEAGNAVLPNKVTASNPKGIEAGLKPAQKSTRLRAKVATSATILVVGLAVGGWLFFSRKAHALTDKDTIVLADFANSTGDPIFDDTLKTALSVALRQSPFLNLLSDDRVDAALQMMTRPVNTRLTPEVTREVCLRTHSKAYIAGSIASLGSEYVLGLKAVNCQSGDTLAQRQVTAASKEKVLDSLGEAAAKLRGELGESLATVQKFDVPLAEATTASLDALRAYSRTDYQRAIELDSSFALAYWMAGNMSNQGDLHREYLTRAFQLRGHASEREKLTIAGGYYMDVTGELDKAERALREVVESYPRLPEFAAMDVSPHVMLGRVYMEQGRYKEAEAVTRQSLRFVPDHTPPYIALSLDLIALQRFDEAHQIIHDAQSRNGNFVMFGIPLYALAFLQADSSAMVEQQHKLSAQPQFENYGLALASDTEAYVGHMRKVRELNKRAVDSAVRAHNKEQGAIYLTNAALQQAAYGEAAQARETATEALKMDSTGQGAESEATLAFAMAGDVARTESLAQDLGKRFPLDTQIQLLWLPSIKAQLAMDGKNPTDALSHLQAASPIEFGSISSARSISCLYQVYMRGNAYLAAGEGSPAGAEFQKILDHNGIVWNCWTGALAHLGVARAYAMQGDTAKAKAAYQDFLTLWKDADPDIPVLVAAKTEYAKLK